MSGQHLKQKDAECVNVDASVISASPNLRGHVMDRANGHRLPTAMAGTDRFTQAIVTNLDGTILIEDVRRFQIAMHDAAIVEIGEPLADFPQEKSGLLRAETRGCFIEQLAQ